jgi:hypothetical protein
MSKLPLQTARSIARPTSFPSKAHLRQTSSSASDRTMCVNAAVNELQAAQGTTSTGRIVNRICTRLANDRATTRTEQLIWLAKHALETSAAPKRNTDRSHDSTSHERSEKDEDKQKAASFEANGKQSQGGVSVWPSMW